MKQMTLDPKKIGEGIDKIIQSDKDLEGTVAEYAAEAYLKMIAHQIATVKLQKTLGQSIQVPGGLPPE